MEYWFGTDKHGRDYWCQVWFAAVIRMALIVAVAESVLGTAISLGAGLCPQAGLLLHRAVQPYLTTSDHHPHDPDRAGFRRQLLDYGGLSVATHWLNMARRVSATWCLCTVTGSNLASRCLGTPLWRVLTKNILPYLVSVIILGMALSIPATISLDNSPTWGSALDSRTPSLGACRVTDGRLPDIPASAYFPSSDRVHHLDFVLYHGQRVLGCG